MRVFAVGPMSERLLNELKENTLALRHFDSFAEAKARLASDPVDAVVLTPAADGSGLSIVHQLKAGAPRSHHLRMTPFFITAPEGTRDDPGYAVIVDPPLFSFLEDGRSRPLIATMRSLNITALISAKLFDGLH